MDYYLSACVNCDSKEDAEARVSLWKNLGNHKAYAKVIVRVREDGTATINGLHDKPLYTGQAAFIVREGE